MREAPHSRARGQRARGTGKGIVAQVLARLVGRHNASFVSMSQLDSPFNGWMNAKSLVVIDELYTGPQIALLNKLKTYITEPTVTINIKNVRTFDYDNVANFFATSNQRNAVALDDFDRRWFVWYSNAAKRGGCPLQGLKRPKAQMPPSRQCWAQPPKVTYLFGRCGC